MGNFTIVIEGTGAHHNIDRQYAADADKMARNFVDALRAAGHSIQHSSFTSSAREDPSDPESVCFEVTKPLPITKDAGDVAVYLADQPINPASGLTAGRIVHYVLPDLQHRPAIVVRTWGSADAVQLIVFTDGPNDASRWPAICAESMTWHSSVAYDKKGNPGTWHWPEKV